MDRNWVVPVVAITFVLVALCCCCALAFAGAFFYLSSTSTPGALEFNPPEEPVSATPIVIRPAWSTPTPAGSGHASEPGSPAATPPVVIEGAAVPTDTLQILENSVVPVNDMLDLAQRLGGKGQVTTTVATVAVPYKVGDKQSFWVTNSESNENFKVPATLRYVTDHAYFWIEDGVSYDRGDLEHLAEAFERDIYPTNREFFGSEWTPGIDGDQHLYILYARNLGGSVAGYFSSADEYPTVAHEYSNAHEMFLLSADLVGLDEDYAYSVLAHEFQHMIHWYRDRNEDIWVNEGFSELAVLLNKYDVGGADYAFAEDPDLQLNDWPNGEERKSDHYGAAFLFMTYFLDRFGENLTKQLVVDPKNGLTGIDYILTQASATDPLTGQPIKADDVFADWTVTNYLNDGDVGDGRYTYHNYSDAPQMEATEDIASCPTKMLTRDVAQYGADYIRIQCRGNQTLHFEGSTQTSVLAENPHSGKYAFWSNKGDESDMTLTRAFDFTTISGPLSISYWTWYDLEKDYDYLYLTASEDGGQTWQILKTPSGTAEDPSGNSYGWGYNGVSGGGSQPRWIEEKVDISQYAGKQVLLRFEYVTDAAVNGEGMMLDDISIPQANYSTDFETGDDGWQAEGWVRIENVLPQTFRLALITSDGQVTVTPIQLSADNTADVPLLFGEGVDEAVLVVSGTSRFTRQRAAYRFEIRP